MADRMTINDYAIKENISRQAVYKRAKTGKIQLIREEENEQIRVYVVEVTPPESSEPETTETIGKEAMPPENITDILSRQIDLLSRQLEEKDRQIEKLNNNVSELTDLLRGSQQLQAHTQLLLEGHKEPVDGISQEENVSESDTGKEEKTKRKGLFSWLFD